MSLPYAQSCLLDAWKMSTTNLTEHSEKMYKSRLSLWDVRKNYTKSEKKKIVEKVKTHHPTGKQFSALSIRGYKVKLNRIRRYCREEKISKEVAHLLPRSSVGRTKNTKALALVHSGGSPTSPSQRLAKALDSTYNSVPEVVRLSDLVRFDPERPFSLTSDLGRIEIVLMHLRTSFGGAAKIYEYVWTSPIFRMQYRPRQNKNPRRAARLGRVSYAADNFLMDLRGGVQSIVQNKPKHGWQMINDACNMLQEVLQDTSVRLVLFLLTTFDDPVWNQVSDLRALLWRYITRLSVLKFGCQHPLSVVSYHLQEQLIFSAILQPAYQILLAQSDSVRRCGGILTWDTVSTCFLSLQGRKIRESDRAPWRKMWKGLPRVALPCHILEPDFRFSRDAGIL